MAADETHDLGFQQRSRSLLNCPSSTTYAAIQSQKAAGMTMSSTSMCESLNRVNSSFSSDWNPLALMVQNAEFEGSLPASHNQITSSAYSIGKVGSQLVGSTSHLVQYPSDPCFVELVPRHEDFGSGSFSHTVTSFGLPDGDQIMDVSSPPAYSRINNKDGTERTTNSRNCNDHGTLLQEDCQRSDDGAMRHSPNGKKRKIVADGHSQLDAIQTAGRERQKDVQLENLECLEDQDEKKQKTEEIPDMNLRDSKQCKSSQNEEATIEDCIHVRARRGQATNSHSLAERLRREKISERMRFLQELVPGCSKITGKAVMLDEIINYVQSLQRQVEFLSMKLATVNPELSTDIEQILSEDILHSGAGTAAILGFAPGMRSSHPHQVTPRGAFQSNQGTNPHFLPISQLPSVWDYELQSTFQMVLNPSPAIFSLEQDGSMKVER